MVSKITFFFKIITRNSPDIYIHCTRQQRSYDPARSNLFRTIASHTDYFQNSFFPYCVNEWNKLGVEIRKSVSISMFKKSLLSFIRPNSRPVFNIIDPTGLKLLTRLRVNLSHLREHKFRHNFLDTVNPLCSCSLEIESTSHYLLRCPFYRCLRKTLLDNIVDIIGSVSGLSDDKLVDLLLYGNNMYSMENNASILKYTIVFLKSSERFDIPLI